MGGDPPQRAEPISKERPSSLMESNQGESAADHRDKGREEHDNEKYKTEDCDGR